MSSIDLRSDTLTLPSIHMRDAILHSIDHVELGDDVYGEDPTVNRLQDLAASMFGKEASIFVPTGCMGNLIAIKIHTHHGNEVICESRSHVNLYELGSMAAIAGCMPRSVTAEKPDGILNWKVIEASIRPKDYYDSQTALICLENSSNVCGGTVYPTATVDDICQHAHAAGLKVHMDGARIFNASVALNESVKEMTKNVDSVMFCLSKGLGAPVGSMLVGNKEFIEKARVYRKMFGGGMRQVGVLASAGIVALEKSPPRLHEDHENAMLLAKEISKMDGLDIDLETVKTNIIVFSCERSGMTAEELCGKLKEADVLCFPFSKFSVRMVTHWNVTKEQVQLALERLKKIIL